MLKLIMEDCNSDLNGASRAKVDRGWVGVGMERRVGCCKGKLLSTFHPNSLRAG